jgi:hypothetical protein
MIGCHRDRVARGAGVLAVPLHVLAARAVTVNPKNV